MSEDRMTETELRYVASDWHGGQSSPLYAFASTGTVKDGILREVDQCIREAEEQGLDTWDLVELAEYAAAHGANF